jgi:hypothetical protein
VCSALTEPALSRHTPSSSIALLSLEVMRRRICLGGAHVSPAKMRVSLSLAKENSSTSVAFAASMPGRRAAASRGGDVTRQRRSSSVTRVSERAIWAGRLSHCREAATARTSDSLCKQLPRRDCRAKLRVAQQQERRLGERVFVTPARQSWAVAKSCGSATLGSGGFSRHRGAVAVGRQGSRLRRIANDARAASWPSLLSRGGGVVWPWRLKRRVEAIRPRSSVPCGYSAFGLLPAGLS